MHNLVAFAGLDGSGKTTQVRLLGKWLQDQGFATAINAPDGPSFISKLLIDVEEYFGDDNLSAHIPDDAACLLRAVMRYRDWNDFLLPALTTSQFAVTDRFAPCYYASIRARDAGAEEALRAIFRRLPKPAMTIFLEVAPIEAYQRIQLRGEDSEKLSFLTAYDRAYRSLPEFADFTVVNGQGSIEEVQQRLRLALQEKFPEIAAVRNDRIPAAAHHA